MLFFKHTDPSFRGEDPYKGITLATALISHYLRKEGYGVPKNTRQLCQLLYMFSQDYKVYWNIHRFVLDIQFLKDDSIVRFYISSLWMLHEGRYDLLTAQYERVEQPIPKEELQEWYDITEEWDKYNGDMNEVKRNFQRKHRMV